MNISCKYVFIGKGSHSQDILKRVWPRLDQLICGVELPLFDIDNGISRRRAAEILGR